MNLSSLVFVVLLVGAETFVTPLAADTTTKQTAGSAKTDAKSIKPVLKITSRTEAEISAITSETSDQLYGRVNITRMAGKSGWWIRTGYGVATTRTYSTKKVNETEIGTFNLDSQYRRDRGKDYTFISAVATIRNRSPHSSVYRDKTGYYMLSAGVGKTIMPGLEGELALAKITRYEDEIDHRITPVYSLRLKTNLSNSMILDGDTHFVQPFADDTLVDTRVNLTCKLNSYLGLRLTYVANNMLSLLQDRTGWDRSFRISLVFVRTGN